MLLALRSSSSSSSAAASSGFSALLQELQNIWTEIGETEADKDRMFLELEHECLGIYRRKIDEAANAKAQLQQSIAAKEAELAMLMATLGEVNVHSRVQSEKVFTSLKGQMATVAPLVEDLKLKKEERMKQLAGIKSQIEKINAEISGYGHVASSLSPMILDHQDLSRRTLVEYQSDLRALQKEKSERLQKVLDYVNEVHILSSVLCFDFGKTVSDVHPSLHGSSLEHVTNVSDSTIEGLHQVILRLKTERKFRLQKLKDVAASLFELWNLMVLPTEEKVNFLRITSVLELSESAIIEPGALSVEIIERVSAEVERLEKLKASWLKERVKKKRLELEDMCCKTHIQPDPSTAAGLVDPCELLTNIERQICKTKDEALCRREIIDKIDRWLSACDEENWLEGYHQDENRYSAGRGSHINLRHAERARAMVKNIPVMVENLISKTLTWEDEQQKLFLYDGVRLVSILEDYKQARQQKEEEKKRAKDQKKLQDMLLAKKETTYASKPSSRRTSSFRKPNGFQSYANGSATPLPRCNSIGSTTPELLTPHSYSGRQNGYFKEMKRLSSTSLNFAEIPKLDTMSFSSVSDLEPESPQGWK